MKYWNIFCGYIMLFFVIDVVSGSSGDRNVRFQNLVWECSLACDKRIDYQQLPLTLRIFGWDCIDNCKYESMHRVVQELIQDGASIPQFYGKWPFIRLLGIQEPASVVFSIGNALANYYGWKSYRAGVNPNYKMYNVVRMYSIIGCNAWFWSVVFHTRDLIWTERLDYFSAGGVIMYSNYLLFVRFFTSNQTLWIARLYGCFLIMLYSLHVYYLAFVRFDYGYNMIANITVGVITALAWLVWFAKVRKERRYAWQLALCVVGTNLAALLEVNDFPPLWWTFDAHSLWHAATIPFAYIWYQFLRKDAEHEMKIADERKSD